MATLFTQIVAGKIPCHKILESEQFLAFLDIRPIQTGHTLVIPKAEVDPLFALGDQEIGSIMVFAKQVARALESAIECQRVGVLVEGFEVPHAHIHLVPLRTGGELSFVHARSVPEEELRACAEKIRAYLPENQP